MLSMKSLFSWDCKNKTRTMVIYLSTTSTASPNGHNKPPTTAIVQLQVKISSLQKDGRTNQLSQLGSSHNFRIGKSIIFHNFEDKLFPSKFLPLFSIIR
jgi:hypothetical protein